MRRVWRRHRWRLISGLGGVVGVVVVLFLVVPAPSITFLPNLPLYQDPDSPSRVSQEPTTFRCHGLFDLPPVEGNRRDDRITDAELNGIYLNSSEAALVYDNYCDRLRSQRLTTALLVSLPSVLLLGVGLLARSQLDEEDYW